MLNSDFSKKMVAQIEEHGTSSRGRKELLAFYKGEKLTMKQALLAHCYDCNGYYEGMGNEKDCHNDNCAMYFFMPYGSTKVKTKSGRVLTVEQKQKMKQGKNK